jgi:hypothetical protein|tara:strand:- start:268 stop:906 length:639 start_codon:yes stop_codon:yes gene_type:complete
MRFLRRYNSGGEVDLPKKKKLETVKDTIAYTGDRRGDKKYDVNTLLSILNFSNSQTKSAPMFELPEEKEARIAAEQSVKPIAYKDKQGNYKVTYREDAESKYEPAVSVSGLKKDFLDKLSGRDLSEKEAGRFRKLMMEPAFLDYFIGIQETEPKGRSFRSVNVAKNVGRKSQNIGAGTTGGKPEGEGIMKIINGVKYWCTEEEGCKIMAGAR